LGRLTVTEADPDEAEKTGRMPLDITVDVELDGSLIVYTEEALTELIG